MELTRSQTRVPLLILHFLQCVYSGFIRTSMDTMEIELRVHTKVRLLHVVFVLLYNKYNMFLCLSEAE